VENTAIYAVVPFGFTNVSYRLILDADLTTTVTLAKYIAGWQAASITASTSASFDGGTVGDTTSFIAGTPIRVVCTVPGGAKIASLNLIYTKGL